MIFCQIDNDLIGIIKKYASGRHIVDVGCGDGLLGSMLDNVISIDLFPRETALIYNIIPMNATEFPFNTTCFPVFIRPCHGYFVDSVLTKHKTNVDNFMYISMPRNLEDDVDLETFNALQVEDWIGNDGERVYIITTKERKECHV